MRVIWLSSGLQHLPLLSLLVHRGLLWELFADVFY